MRANRFRTGALQTSLQRGTFVSQANDGPSPATLKIRGSKRNFFDYTARPLPDGPDNGNTSAWAMRASLPFAPQFVLPSIPQQWERYCDIGGSAKNGHHSFFRSRASEEVRVCEIIPDPVSETLGEFHIPHFSRAAA